MAFTNRIPILLFSSILVFSQAAAQKITQAKMDSMDILRIAYIENYKDLAMLEMYKSGIPASITLAQGMLETAAGTSVLCRTANNHFGMKCGASWEGSSYYKNDDEFDKAGKPIKSCFRSYADPADNFADHSEFLRDPQKHNRYGFLFQLDPIDYVAWAQGLQASGYSPVGHYSARIIEFVERYHLHELDYQAWQQRLSVPANLRTTQVNNVTMLYAVEGETLTNISRSCGVSVEKLIEYNENLHTAWEVLRLGTPVYLAPKQNSWGVTDLEYFYAQDGMNMAELSQLLGIKASSLRKMNNLTDKQEPAQKAKIRVQGQRKPTDKVTLRAPASLPAKRPYTPRNLKPHQRPVVSDLPMNAANQRQLNQVLKQEADMAQARQVEQLPVLPIEVDEPTSGRVIFHEVNNGETLIGVARRYNVSVGDLRRWNNLKGDVIKVGQRLVVK
jgi:LysM repeat protein